jgi:hypothetical protein
MNLGHANHALSIGDKWHYTSWREVYNWLEKVRKCGHCVNVEIRTIMSPYKAPHTKAWAKRLADDLKAQGRVVLGMTRKEAHSMIGPSVYVCEVYHV